MSYRLEINNVAKHFDRLLLFKKIDAMVEQGQLLTISGENGSGKSTLLRIIAGLLKPSRGDVVYFNDTLRLERSQLCSMMTMAAPAINLYDELTAHENLTFLATIKGSREKHRKIDSLLEQVGLARFKHELYGIYSTGMKQRLKIAAAVLNDPSFLLLDEPFSNLDENGRQIVLQIIAEQRRRGCTVIASNIKEDIELGDVRIELS